MVKILNEIIRQVQAGEKGLAVLIDPDKGGINDWQHMAGKCGENGVDYIFVGGSSVDEYRLQECIEVLKPETDIPLILFPGDYTQVSEHADALLFLSLVSGRNAEYLIGQHVKAVRRVVEAGIETVPTGYLLIDGGTQSSVQYVSNTQPIPVGAVEIAVNTALAARLMGMQLIYLEAGSGAKIPVSARMVAEVKQQVQLPLIVGGGIRSAEQAYVAAVAGADIIVVGNILEKSPELLADLSLAVKAATAKSKTV